MLVPAPLPSALYMTGSTHQLPSQYQSGDDPHKDTSCTDCDVASSICPTASEVLSDTLCSLYAVTFGDIRNDPSFRFDVIVHAITAMIGISKHVHADVKEHSYYSVKPDQLCDS